MGISRPCQSYKKCCSNVIRMTYEAFEANRNLTTVSRVLGLTTLNNSPSGAIDSNVWFNGRVWWKVLGVGILEFAVKAIKWIVYFRED